MKRANDDVDKYIARFPENVQKALEELMQAIQTAAPEAEEAMSYGVPAFRLKGNLALFAAFKNHIGFYPEPSAIEAFREELVPYSLSEGTIRFPLGKPIPLDLVARIIRYRVNQNLSK